MPTIGLVDYSRRETDDFGVTTVVERGFARRMSVRLIAPFAEVDALQRNLANLRAQAVQWVADERFDWLNFQGFYKDFEIDLALPPVSYCTLSVEGLTASEPFADPGGDPAPSGLASSLQLLQPVPVVGAELVAASVPETDYPEWAVGDTYPLGAHVIKAATHRIYESVVPGNLGDDPAAASGKWLDIGPTNRWAMFDEALGSATSAANQISVTIAAGVINAVALLDVHAATVRVQAGAYDRTTAPNESGTVTFLDLPSTGGQVTVTIAGPGIVEVGTLLVGDLVGLGSTTDSPKAAIDDYSRKEADEFGEVIVVERAWAKRMTARAMIRTDAIDVVAGRIAAVRARPALWIGKDGLESLTIYGFFKDFSIEVDATVSRLSLSIEGLSTAGKVEPLGAAVDWPDIADPDGTKPEENATVGAPPGTPVGDGNAQDAMDALKALASTTTAADIVEGAKSLVERQRNNLLATYNMQILAEERKDRWERLTHLDGSEIGTRVRQEINERTEQGEALIEMLTSIEATATDGIDAAMAAIELEQVVRASADSAETAARELAISLFQSDVGGLVSDLQAAIVSEASTRADADSAEADLRQALAATLDGAVNDLNAAILVEQNARVTADEAEATARAALAATLSGGIADVSALVLEEQTARVSEDEALASQLFALETTFEGQTAEIVILAESVDGLFLRYGVKLDSNGHVIGFLANNDGVEGGFDFVADYFRVWDAAGTFSQAVFEIDGDTVKMPNVEVDRLKAGSGNSAQFAAVAASTPVPGAGMGTKLTVLTRTVTLLAPGSIQALAALAISYAGSVSNSNLTLRIGGVQVFSVGGATSEISAVLAGSNTLAAGTYSVEVAFEGPSNMTIIGRNLATTIVYS
ncbi:hypothetical protein [Novosphingobium sp. AP12]|uniref:hypothetical protein n=1 Tax=Novosphingobium sp. AP12 TaxID=1144305 RepID=UPI0012FAC124|nr:hypothetical protein [Novosphingobium sp. AP12]